jgi:hypothetical protein
MPCGKVAPGYVCPWPPVPIKGSTYCTKFFWAKRKKKEKRKRDENNNILHFMQIVLRKIKLIEKSRSNKKAPRMELYLFVDKSFRTANHQPGLMY